MNMHVGPPFVPAWIMIALVGVAIVVVIFYVIRALGKSAGAHVVLILGGILAVVLFMGIFSLRVVHQVSPQPVPYDSGLDQIASPIPVVTPDDNPHGSNSITTVQPGVKIASDASTVTTEANPGKPNSKPAWLSQGTQTGNGVSQFPVSSELFATVAECQKDLDNRTPALIAEEVRYLRGEPEPISLLAGEAQRLTADTFTEEVTTSQGTWYKVHRLIKIDQSTWAMFRTRFHQAQLQARLETIGLGFGGVMLVLGVVYLFLRRKPRVVDPTLNTFSTT